MAKIETCFVAAPLGAKTEVIRDVLHRHDIRIVSYGDLLPGLQVRQNVVDLIQKADLFVAVIHTPSVSSETGRDNVLFELGIAMGAGKRVLIFAPPSGDFLPSGLNSLLTVRASLQNRDAIDFAVSQVLAAPPLSPDRNQQNTQSSDERGIGDAADQLWADYLEVRDRRDGYGFERLVSRAIRASGIDVISETKSPDNGVDLAVWSDSFHTTVGNPFLIQLKLTLHNRTNYKRITDQLAVAARSTSSPWSLLIYGEGPSAASRWSTNPTVLVISIRDLLEEMRGRPFTDVVRRLRDRRAHGLV
ncbi:restriction endonuclease [Agrobacterium rosae]|uniref:Restriction endonuclease type IV Mrr domain-containing protein n=1 Tax=Agrobacterium rosae TaxID=1972867 RepID=A0A1R3TXR9_9HYPH|nr:restriction endonuclease [Agrobacterium rosae]SCX31669.1 hypothetical protein DSM25559_3779 [Agrobacterium rosae]